MNERVEQLAEPTRGTALFLTFAFLGLLLGVPLWRELADRSAGEEGWPLAHELSERLTPRRGAWLPEESEFRAFESWLEGRSPLQETLRPYVDAFGYGSEDATA